MLLIGILDCTSSLNLQNLHHGLASVAVMQAGNRSASLRVPPCPRSQLGGCHAWPAKALPTPASASGSAAACRRLPLEAQQDVSIC